MVALKTNNFIFIVGLPASGKTFFSKKISKALNIPFLDDPSDLEKISNFIKRNPCGIINSPLLCDGSFRFKVKRKLKYFKVTSIWFYFENNPKQCLKNDQKRKQKASSDITYFSSIYKIPSRSNRLKVLS